MRRPEPHRVPLVDAADVLPRLTTPQYPRVNQSRPPGAAVCAGAGYWARLLRDLGGDVLAYDHYPAERNHWLTGAAPGHSAPVTPNWTTVAVADGDLVAREPGRAIFVCWPPRPGSGYLVDILRRYRPPVVALITQGLRLLPDVAGGLAAGSTTVPAAPLALPERQLDHLAGRDAAATALSSNQPGHLHLYLGVVNEANYRSRMGHLSFLLGQLAPPTSVREPVRGTHSNVR
ncbi:hypothetical protein GCM10009734_97520 [Nonomuraea bangladeshensis]